MAPISLAAVNRKGGCSKTSTVFHLAGEFGRRDKRVLVIDCDPQASLSQGFFGPSMIDELPDEQTLTALFNLNVRPDAQLLVKPTPFDNISVVCGSDAMTHYNLPDPWEQGAMVTAIADFMTTVEDQFDVILLDNPPNLQLASYAAIVASDFVITPLAPEDFAAMGIVHVKRFIDAAKAYHKPSLEWMGLLLTMFQKRLVVHVTYEEQLRELYGDLVFNTVIPLAAPFKEAVASRQPLAQYKPRVAGAKSIKALADEIEVRIAARQQTETDESKEAA